MQIESNHTALLLIGFGPTGRHPNESPNILRKAIDTKLSITPRGSKGPKEYASLDAAIEARQRAVTTYPGDQSISYEAAKVSLFL